MINWVLLACWLSHWQNENLFYISKIGRIMNMKSPSYRS